MAVFVCASGLVCESVIDGFQRFSLGLGLPSPPEAARLLIGSLVVAAAIGVLASLTGRLWLSTGVAVGLSTALGFFNALKLSLRFEPVYPGDLTMAGEGSSIVAMIGWTTLIDGLVLTSVAVLLTVAVAWLLRRVGLLQQATNLWSHRRAWRARIVILAVSAAVIIAAADFQNPGDPLRRAYEATGSTWAESSQAAVYAREGFIGGTLANLDPAAMSTPRGYTKAAMDHLRDRYTALAARKNSTRDPGLLHGTNVVLVMSESFSDPRQLSGFSVHGDPLRFTHQLMQASSSGRMLSPEYGGGTANVEFEALTGFSMSQLLPSLTYPYSMLVAHRRHFPSVVDLMRREGHRAVAIHPHLASFYSRDLVYPAMGFERFITQDDMRDKVKDGHDGYISDDSAFEEVAHELATSARPMFVHLVTMQNHEPYDARYPDPVRTSLTGTAANTVGNYLTGLSHSDVALRRFVRRIRQLREPTVLVFFGDHQPGIWPGSVRAASGRARMFETPYFVWSSQGRLPTATPPVMSPIYFMPDVCDMLNAPLPPFFELLRELQGHVAALDSGMMFDRAGIPTTTNKLGPAGRRLLRDYKLVQFDVTQGRHYLSSQFFSTPS